MYHAPDAAADRKKRPRKQPPNQVWLDAIMSKTRATEPSPRGAAAPPPMRRGVADEPMDDAGWPRTGPFPDGPPARASRTPSPAVSAVDDVAVTAPPPPPPFVDQLAVEGSALVAALTTALKDLVSEQDCSFIARGVCHLCSDKEKKFVPVVNFCPSFSPTHSLCREHLRSMHRVRLVDIFAGKNQPTVSKRALRCAVCSLSCPCSKCQLRRDAEIARYMAWLRGPRPSSLEALPQDQEIPMARHGRSQHTTPPPATRGAGEYDDHGSRRPSRHQLSDHGMNDVPMYPHADGKQRSSEQPTYFGGGEHKLVSDDGFLPHGTVDAMAAAPHTSLQADEKGPSRNTRFPKRAAKESVPYALDETSAGYAPPPPPPSHRRPSPSGLRGGSAAFAPHLSSPSAASVLNCPDSEKSLVDLLSSLNQRVTPAVRYFADADESRFRDMMEHAPYTYERGGGPRVNSPHTADVAVMYSNDEYEANTRRQKRKRDSIPSSRASEGRSTPVGYDTEDDAPLRVNGSSVRLQTDGDRPSSYRQKAPTALVTGERKLKPAGRSLPAEKPPSPSPRGRQSGRTKTSTPPPEPKMLSARKRDVPVGLPPSAMSSTRKRKSDTQVAAPPPVGDRKIPRGTAHRGRAHKSSPAKQGHRALSAEKDEAKDADGEGNEGGGDDDSELDTNLDYCEVCLAAGDLVCCDFCPRSFHLKCLKMTEDDLPEGDWQCAECRKPSYFESFGAAVAEQTSVPAKCLQIIQCLKSHPFSKPFLVPVENVPHYTNIVKQPMDLSTIERKLLDNKYMVSGKGTMQGTNGASKVLHLGAFAEDVRLVWSNCKLFNDDGSGITRAADQLSDGFEKLFQDVLDFVDSSKSTHVEEMKSSTPPAFAQTQERVPAEPSATRSIESSSIPTRGGESRQSPPPDPARDDSVSETSDRHQLKSSAGVAKVSNLPNGLPATVMTEAPSASVSASGKESKSLAASDASSLSSDAERVVVHSSTDRSLSPVESATTAFMETATDGPPSIKRTEPETNDEAASNEQASLSKESQSPAPSRDGGNTDVYNQPTE